MENTEKKYRAGLIDRHNYEKMMDIITYFEDNEYEYIENIGEGSYGCVVKVRNVATGEVLAAKIIDEFYATCGEIKLWETLKHESILTLIKKEFATLNDFYIFFTPLCPVSLEKKILEKTFMTDENSFSTAINWLKQVVDGVVYLHGRNLSHNDIKCNNVLIKDDGTAVLADFGFLSLDEPVTTYGAPLIYRCPEGGRTKSGLQPIDGKKLDVWTLGILAFEIFTGMSLYKQLVKSRLFSWFADIYPVLQSSLRKDNFINLMQNAFPVSENIDEKVDDILNFIIASLNIVPEQRPEVLQLQKHKLFGGIWEKENNENQIDIWQKRASKEDLDGILELNHSTAILVPLYDDNHGDNKYALHSVQNSIETAIIHSQKCRTISNRIIPEENFTNKTINNCYTVSDECSLTIAGMSIFHETSISKEKMKSSSTVYTDSTSSSPQSCCNEEECAIHENMDEGNKCESKEDEGKKRDCPSVSTKKLSNCQKFRNWCNRQKSSFLRALNTCFCCVKNTEK